MFKAHIKAVVLKLFQDEAHLCKVNYFVAPQKKTHDETFSYNKLTFYLQIFDCTKNKRIFTILKQQFCL